MRSRTKRQVPWILLLALAPAGHARAADEPARTRTETTLRPAPGSSETQGLLSRGTPATVLERQEGWVRVRVEAWIPASALDAAEPEPPTTPAEVPAASRAGIPAAGPAAVTVEGSFSLKLRELRKRGGAGALCWLVPPSADLGREEHETAESNERLAALEQQAAQLEREAARAMSGSNFTAAMQQHDRLMVRRARVLDERQTILAARHGRHEARARGAAVAHSVADSKGWFSFTGVPAGTYVLYARLTRDDLDLEWIQTVAAEHGTVRIDLDEASARGLLDTSE